MEEELALVLWGNTTLGILLYWWHCNKQQAGRGSIAKLLLNSLCVFDVRNLTAEQKKVATELLKEMAEMELKPIHELAEDTNRQRLDKAFLGDVLGLPASLFQEFGALHLVRQKLSREPSIRGHKSG
jgi:hypothetical protein